MSTFFVRFVSRLLVVCMIGLPFQVSAGMIGTGDVVTATQAAAARTTVANFLNRTEVASQLQTLGLTAQAAQDRVAALTDTEVANLAGQIDSLPAGASDGWIVAGVILIGVLVWYFWIRK
jgi:hypothetical protein